MTKQREGEMRPAEEIAREALAAIGFRGPEGEAFVGLDGAIRATAAAITRARAEGAATERARQQTAHVSLCLAPDVPGQWIAHHIKRDLVTQGNSETHALRMLAEAIEMVDGAPAQFRETVEEQEARHLRELAALREASHEDALYREESAAAEREKIEALQDECDHWQRSHDSCVEELKRLHADQPRDLAGRIRGLIQQKAGEWADSVAEDYATSDALSEVMRWLFNAAYDVRTGEDVSKRVVAMRRAAGAARKRTALVFAKTADEIESIVRECEEKR